MQHLPIHPSLLHPLTGQPLRAIGVVGGRVIWPIMGASEDSGDANDGADDSGNGDDGDQNDDGSGDDNDDGDQRARELAGLVQERNGRKAAETLLSELTGRSKLEIRRLLKDGPDGARDALKPKGGDGGGDQVDVDEIRREAERAATDKANARLVRAEVRALAAETFANPLDALHNLDLGEYEVDEDGELEDADAVKAALANVLKKNPHYAKKGKGPKPDPSQGPRGGAKVDPGPGMARLRQAYADTSK